MARSTRTRPRKPKPIAAQRIAHAKAAQAREDYYANRPGRAPKPQRLGGLNRPHTQTGPGRRTILNQPPHTARVVFNKGTLIKPDRWSGTKQQARDRAQRLAAGAKT